jgi:signal transduction histidine kinase
LGLATALRLLVENFARAQKLELQTDLDDFDDLFEMPVQTTIYRTVQECLTNTGKHAEANKLWFRAKLAGAEVSFGIEDDGKGFNVKKALAAKNTLGLLTMEERVKNLGGAIEIVSQERRGTTISFTIPVPNKESRT